MEKTFGSFICEKRTQKNITLRTLANMIGVSPVYISSMEKGRRSAPKYPVLLRFAQALMLNDDEKILFFDLAAKSKKSPTIAADLLTYINENEIVHKALRTAKMCNATDEDWQNFIDSLLEKEI